MYRKWSKPISWTAVAFLILGITIAMFPFGGPNPTGKLISSDILYVILIICPTVQTMNYTVVINMAVWGGCLIYYFVDARKWFEGPKVTLDLGELTAAQEQELIDEGLVIEGIATAVPVIGSPKNVQVSEKLE